MLLGLSLINSAFLHSEFINNKIIEQPKNTFTFFICINGYLNLPLVAKG